MDPSGPSSELIASYTHVDVNAKQPNLHQQHPQHQHHPTKTTPIPASCNGQDLTMAHHLHPQRHQQNLNVHPYLQHQPPPQTYDRTVIDELLKNKRKARELKACYPCRQRKVRCNGELPCENCIQREHPELCVMLGPEKRQRGQSTAGAQRGTSTTPPSTFANLGGGGRGYGGSPVPTLPIPQIANSANPFDAMMAKLTAIENTVCSLKGELLKLRESTQPPLPPVVHNSSPTYSHPGPPAHFGMDNHSESASSVQRLPSISGSSTGTPDTPTACPTLPVPTSSTTSSSPSKMGIHARDDTTGATVYLGRNSVPAFVYDQQGGSSSPHRRGRNSSGVRSSGGTGGAGRDDSTISKRFDHDFPLQVFALHNSTVTYPFTTHLWSPQLDIDDMAQVLPADKDIVRYFEAYRDLAHRIYPVIVDIGKFEMELRGSLRDRAAAAASGEKKKVGRWRNPSWMALLFAVLASGTQFSDDPRKERELSSRVYVCCSFQCLRIANYFIQPMLEQIQALLLLGNCIRNDTNPGAAWILLGLTIRLAQSLGLHQASTDLPPSTQETHRKIWWSVMWQDALLSFSYDRPHGAVTIAAENSAPPRPPSPNSPPTFLTIMYAFLRVVMDILIYNDLPHPTSTSPLISFQSRLEEIRHDALSSHHLSQLERLTVRIHTGYMISQICRTVLRRAQSPSSTPSPTTSTPSHPTSATEDYDHYTTSCLENSADVIQAFVEMHHLSPAATRSWAFVHNALSCALLLGLLPDVVRKRDGMRELLERMIRCLEELEADGSGKNYEKSLNALRGICDQRCGGMGGGREEGMGIRELSSVGRNVAGNHHNMTWTSTVMQDPPAPPTLIQTVDQQQQQQMWDEMGAKIMDSIIWGESGGGGSEGAGVRKNWVDGRGGRGGRGRGRAPSLPPMQRP